jgi:hypothetical protein
MGIKTRKRARGSVPYWEIKTAYTKAFNIKWYRMILSDIATFLHVGGIFRFADAFYHSADDGLIAYELEQDHVDKERYKAEDFDCDDFTFSLHGSLHKDLRTAMMPIFVTWVKIKGKPIGHALLSYYIDDKVFLIEPQTDEVIHPVPAEYQLTLLCG